MSEIFLEQWKPSLQYGGQEDVTGQHTLHLTFLYHSGFLLPRDQCTGLTEPTKNMSQLITQVTPLIKWKRLRIRENVVGFVSS